MKNKILWLSILGLALARPPNPIDSEASNVGEEQKQRTSRSIWPFTSSETTTEEPVNYPPSLPDNNEWFVQGETPLPQGIDLNKYPVWKVHKYNGIDLHPVKLQPENTYPPEQHVVEQGYSSGSSFSSDFSQNNHQNGYQDFGTHSAGYDSAYSAPSAPYPAEEETYQTGEFHSSNFGPGANPFNIQTQQKYEVYAPQPFKAVPELPQIPSASYGQPNAYRPGNVDYQGHNQEGQTQGFGAGEQHSQSSNGRKPDLSFLDDLGGLAPFLPEPTTNNENDQEEESDAQEEGFFERLFSRFRGQTETPAADDAIAENEEPTNSGGFLSSVFGLRSDTQSPEIERSATESSGNAFSSLFYQPETEKPAVVLPTTYYLPKTRGSYIAVKLPANPASSFTPSLGPYDDVSNIAFHEVPKVPFTQHEIPHIPGPTFDSGYRYNVGYSDVRNSGFANPASSSDYQPAIVYGQPYPPMTKVTPHFKQDHGNYQQPDFGVNSFSSSHGDALDRPHAEYMHSAYNGQHSSIPTTSSQSSSGTKYYQEQQNSHDSRTSAMHQIPSTILSMPQSEDEFPRSNANAMTSSIADELDQIQNEKLNQNLNSQEHQYQTFDSTHSNVQSTSNTQDAFDHHNLDSLSLGQTVNENAPISDPQIASGFIPSLSYSSAIETSDQQNFNANNQENGQLTTSTSENAAYDHSSDNIGDSLPQNFDVGPILSHDLLPQKETELDGSSIPVYQTPIPTFENPSDAPEQNEFGFLPVKPAINFHDTSSDQENDDSLFINNLSALTSYGTPTNSYNSNPFVAASSNVRNIAIPAPMKDEVNDGVNINMNKDVFRFTLPEQLPTKKVGRVVRKVMKRRNFVESNNSRRSIPERQAPTEETGTSLIIRSEKDSIPEVRGSRQFLGTEVIDGYSKVEHRQHQFVADTSRISKPVNTMVEIVQQ